MRDSNVQCQTVVSGVKWIVPYTPRTFHTSRLVTKMNYNNYSWTYHNNIMLCKATMIIFMSRDISILTYQCLLTSNTLHYLWIIYAYLCIFLLLVCPNLLRHNLQLYKSYKFTAISLRIAFNHSCFYGRYKNIKAQNYTAHLNKNVVKNLFICKAT